MWGQMLIKQYREITGFVSRPEFTCQTVCDRSLAWGGCPRPRPHSINTKETLPWGGCKWCFRAALEIEQSVRVTWKVQLAASGRNIKTSELNISNIFKQNKREKSDQMIGKQMIIEHESAPVKMKFGYK